MNRSRKNKHSIRTSHVWNDYHELTSKNWMPIRLIKHKRLNPETSKYSTNKLVKNAIIIGTPCKIYISFVIITMFIILLIIYYIKK